MPTPKRTQHIDEEATRKAHKMYWDNRRMSLADIGAIHGVTGSAMRLRFMRYGLECKPQWMVRSTIDKKQADAITARLHAGEWLRDIVDELGLSYNAVRNRLRDFGCDVPNQQHPRVQWASSTGVNKVENPERPPKRVHWKALLDQTEISDPRPVDGGYEVDVVIRGQHMRTWEGSTPRRADDIARRYVRALAAYANMDSGD